MKKHLFSIVCCALGYTLAAQTFVSTTPANKNAVIEEYTGACCTYCPDGHKKVNEIMASYPDRVWGINIHAGYYTQGTGCESRFTCPAGEALHAYYLPLIGGYPVATVSRGTFTSDRGAWGTAVSAKLIEPSCLNVAAQGTIDWATRTLTLDVEVYYTGNADSATNFLTVALLQDNIMGYQTGASTYNPDMVLPTGDYLHNHMLRDIISPVWGDTIATTTQGYCYSKTYTYLIPAKVNTVDVLLEDIRVLAYVYSTKDTLSGTTVISGAKAVLTDVNKPQRLNTIISKCVENKSIYLDDCDNTLPFMLFIRNLGDNAINSITYNVTIGGQTVLQNQVWNARSIGNGGRGDTISFRVGVTANTVQTVAVEITKINDADTSIQFANMQVRKYVVEEAGGNMLFRIVTDAYAAYSRFMLIDETNTIVLSGNYYTSDAWQNQTTVGPTVERLYHFNPQTIGCYTLLVQDAYGIGLNKGYGAGYFELIAEDGTVLFYNDGKFGATAQYNIKVTTPATDPPNTTPTLGVTDINASAAKVVLYPNPANDYIELSSTNATIQKVELYNIQGQLIKAKQTDFNSVSVSDLASGMYSVRITTDKGVSVKKFVKQ
jgi:hypothetical protein